MIKPTWQDWHNKSKALLESEAFKDYEQAIDTFHGSNVFKNYHMAKLRMFNDDQIISEGELKDLNWEDLGNHICMKPYDIKYAHETWGVKIYSSMKYEIKGL